MANYVLIYSGGSMPETDAEREAVMAAWGQWFGGLGAAVVDGGNPFGPGLTVSPGGAVAQGTSTGANGYSILAAGDLAAAGEMAKGCPLLSGGGTVEVHEVFPIM